MKTLIFPLLGVIFLTVASQGQDAALVTVSIGKEKALRQFAIELHTSEAPRHVENFEELAKKGFYKGTKVHRVFPETLVQMGDPLSRKKERSRVGTGGPGYTLDPEIRRKHIKGAVAAARLPDKINPSRKSNGSQFYICLAPMPALDGQYTVFGQVLWGLDVVADISRRPADSNDNPIDRILIKSVKILPKQQLPSPPLPVSPGSKPDKKPWWKIFS